MVALELVEVLMMLLYNKPSSTEVWKMLLQLLLLLTSIAKIRKSWSLVNISDLWWVCYTQRSTKCTVVCAFGLLVCWSVGGWMGGSVGRSVGRWVGK